VTYPAHTSGFAAQALQVPVDWGPNYIFAMRDTLMVCSRDDGILRHVLCLLDDWRSNEVDNLPMMTSDWLQELGPFSSSSRLFSPITSHLHNQSTS